jgi:hypothetical protein
MNLGFADNPINMTLNTVTIWLKYFFTALHIIPLAASLKDDNINS